jgi:hypothetical protein
MPIIHFLQQSPKMIGPLAPWDKIAQSTPTMTDVLKKVCPLKQAKPSKIPPPFMNIPFKKTEQTLSPKYSHKHGTKHFRNSRDAQGKDF